MFQIIMILGLLLGNIVAVILPYFRKLNEGKIEKFDIKYLYHSVGATVWQFIISIPLWLQWKAPSGFTIVFAFIFAFAFGFGGKGFQAEVLKYVQRANIHTPVDIDELLEELDTSSGLDRPYPSKTVRKPFGSGEPRGE